MKGTPTHPGPRCPFEILLYLVYPKFNHDTRPLLYHVLRKREQLPNMGLFCCPDKPSSWWFPVRESLHSPTPYRTSKKGMPSGHPFLVETLPQKRKPGRNPLKTGALCPLTPNSSMTRRHHARRGTQTPAWEKTSTASFLGWLSLKESEPDPPKKTEFTRQPREPNGSRPSLSSFRGSVASPHPRIPSPQSALRSAVAQRSSRLRILSRICGP